MSEPADAITLRLLRVFDIVYQTRNLSQAADRLGVSQPNVSIGLKRLRDHFNDPLFVRVGAKMEPTSRAEALIEAIRSILLIANAQFVAQSRFDQQASKRCFTIHMTDLGETILVPTLINHLSRHAPGITLRVRQIDSDSQALLASGAIDLIIGYLAKVGEGFLQRKLFDERFVCIARAGHPRIKGQFSIEQFKAEAHIHVAASGTGHLQIERGFDQLRIHAEPVLELPGFLAVGEVVTRTDLVATVPSRLAALLVRRGDIQVFALPFESLGFQVRQYWHSRFSNDAGNRWLRELIVNQFADSAKSSAAASGPE